MTSQEMEYPYATYLNVLCSALEVVDVPTIISSCTDPWFNQTLCQVNDSVVRLSIAQGEYHWHKHDNDDEFFFTIDGLLIVDVENGESVELRPQQGYVVPSRSQPGGTDSAKE